MRARINVGLFILMAMTLMTGCASMGIRSVPVETLMKKYHVSESDFMEINGIKIHFKDEGKGEPLVLLHGICSSLYTWDGWVASLKDRYRIIRIDLPGWGLTGDIGPDSCDVEKMVQLIDEVAQTLGIETFYLAGNSLGGYLSWNYAVAYPNKVKKMILLDPVSYPQPSPWFINMARVPVLNLFPEYVMPKFLVCRNIDEVYGDSRRITDEQYDLYFDLTLREGNRKSYVELFKCIAKNSENPSLGDHIKKLTVPTLLMYGEKDRWVPPEHIKLWEKDVPGVLSIIYPGAGHVPMEEIPERTAADACAFLRGASPERTPPIR